MAQKITENNINLSDNTTLDFSTTKHGFVPKGTNLGRFLKDDGTWADVPAPDLSGDLGLDIAQGMGYAMP